MAASEGDFSSSEPSCIAPSDQLSRATLAGGPKKPEIPAWPKSEIRVGDDYQVCCRLGALTVLRSELIEYGCPLLLARRHCGFLTLGTPRAWPSEPARTKLRSSGRHTRRPTSVGTRQHPRRSRRRRATRCRKRRPQPLGTHASFVGGRLTVYKRTPSKRCGERPTYALSRRSTARVPRVPHRLLCVRPARVRAPRCERRCERAPRRSPRPRRRWSSTPSGSASRRPAPYRA